MALDLQRALDELKQERQRSRHLLLELQTQSHELEKLRHSVHRESNSRFLAEEALDETRDRLQLAVDAAGLALWDWPVGSDQVFLSARWGEFLGQVNMDAKWPITELFEHVHPDDVPGLKLAAAPLIKGMAQRAVAEFRVKGPGGWHWLEAHGMVAERDTKGGSLRLMGTVANIDAHKRTEADSAKARDLAEQASRAKSEFLANISHEVRTPLNALMGLTRMLMDSPLTPEQANWLQLMDNSAQSLLTLLNDILDLSRIEAGKLQMEHTRYELAAELEEIVGPYGEQARGKPLAFDLNVSPDLPRWVMGDPGRLRQVLGNLLSNAIKFTPKGGQVTVRASAQAAPNGEKRLLIQVQDTGVGIAKRHQGSIFDPFTQADASVARFHGGSGLGLAICSKLVRLMGGAIALESDLGQGSLFTVTLPLHISTAAEPGPMSGPAELIELAEAGPRYAGMVVLLAEDHPVNELMMRQLLIRLGCTVRIARGGAQAVAQWEQGGLDLILMDVQMPGVSGLEATRQIREAETRRKLARTPIVAVTANAMAGDRETCLKAGMDGYVPKPVSPQALMQEIDRVWHRPDHGLPLVPDTTPTAPATPPAPAAMAEAPAKPAVAKASTPQTVLPEPLDVAKLRRRLDGDDATLRQLAAAMRNDLANRQKALRSALSTHDTGSAVAHAHGLKGSLGSMTAERGARLAKGLELAARAEDWQLFERALPLMDAEAKRIDVALAALLQPGDDLFDAEPSDQDTATQR
jgi:signal transduction histidine kinase/DNA-binding response OmpR family regulator